MTHPFRSLWFIALALSLAACTKVMIAPDGTPYNANGPRPPSAAVRTPGPEASDPAEASSEVRDVPPPISLGPHEEGASEPEHPSSPVVARLSREAQSQKRSGKLEQALATTERALRIDPTDPHSWLLLGEIQLARGNDIQAEQLARKSISLAGKDTALKARSWRLIQAARRRRGDTAGADDALEKARNLENDGSRTK